MLCFIKAHTRKYYFSLHLLRLYKHFSPEVNIFIEILIIREYIELP
jgi:hypothetical protein